MCTSYNELVQMHYGYSGTSLYRTLWIKNTSLMRKLSAVPTTLRWIQIYLWTRDISLYRTANWTGPILMVSSIERFHCIDYRKPVVMETDCSHGNNIWITLCTVYTNSSRHHQGKIPPVWLDSVVGIPTSHWTEVRSHDWQVDQSD